MTAKLTTLLSVLFLTSSCSTSEKIRLTIWSGVPAEQKINNKVDSVSTADPAFGGYKCMTDEDMEKLYRACLVKTDKPWWQF